MRPSKHHHPIHTFVSAASRFAQAAALCVMAGLPASAGAASWPERPIKIIVSQSPGGASDMQARMISQPLADALGQPVVIENKPGASGLIGAEMAALAAPDGYTILLFQDLNTIFPSIMKKIRHDPATSFEPITLVGTSPAVLLANSASPLNTVQELVDYARQNPNKLSYAIAGIGTTQHLAIEIFQHRVGIKMTAIPYKGGGQAIVDVVSGQVPLAALGVPPILSHVKAGTLKVLAVTGHARSPFLPDAPTFQELGFSGLEEIGQWNGFVVPAGTPPAIVARLHDEIVKIMSMPEILEKMKTIGMVPTTSATPDDFKKLIADELKRWPDVVQAAGIEPQ